MFLETKYDETGSTTIDQKYKQSNVNQHAKDDNSGSTVNIYGSAGAEIIQCCL